MKIILAVYSHATDRLPREVVTVEGKEGMEAWLNSQPDKPFVCFSVVEVKP